MLEVCMQRGLDFSTRLELAMAEVEEIKLLAKVGQAVDEDIIAKANFLMEVETDV